MRKEATIRKWYGSWGIAHGYAGPDTPPNKFFIHTSNRTSQEAILNLGVKISFTEGPARTAKELPVALEIEVVPILPLASPVKKNGEKVGE